jgi:serine protease AprX
MSSSVPPENQPKVGQFDPLQLDRTVIALPLLREMQLDFERIEEIKALDPTLLDKYTAAIEYNPIFPGGIDAAYQAVLAQLKVVSDRALKAAADRLERATEKDRDAEVQRRKDLETSIADQEIAPPMSHAPYSLARLHASIIRRLLSVNTPGRYEKDEQRMRPLVDIHPKRFEIIIDLNLEHWGGRVAARQWVLDNIDKAKTDSGVRDAGQGIHHEKEQPDTQYIFARLEARAIRELVKMDTDAAKAQASARKSLTDNSAVRERIDASKCRAIYHIWPDFEVSACINKSIATVKCDAAQNAFSALGDGITWAVMDSGINKDHRHFATFGSIDPTSTMHRDFTIDGGGPFEDLNGHGTHVAGIIGGAWRKATLDEQGPLAISRSLKKGTDDVELIETRLEGISGMAPRCKLVSLRVLDENGKGSVSNLIAAIQHVQEINGFGRRLLIHGVNMSLGYNFEPEWFACGQSPLCVEVDRLVKTGVVVVVAAGNTGYGTLKSTIGATTAGMALTINDPGNSDLAITVGSTHRDMPHTYGVSYFSSKGPTGDGRMKPDLVAPGEKIISCAAGGLKTAAAPDKPCDYVETSGTSMAAPHVSGAIAAFLSVRTEFIGKSERVKEIFLSSCTDLRRDRYFQGSGLIDLMRAIQSV